MKILLIHNYYQTNSTGGEDIVYNQEVELLKKYLGSENVFTYVAYNDKLKFLTLVFNIWFSFSSFFKVRKLVRRNNINIVHVHNYYPLLTPSIFFAAKLAGAKVVHTLHNYRLWCLSGILYRDNVGICELCVKSKFAYKSIQYKCYRGSRLQSVIAQLSFWFYRATLQFRAIDYYFVLTPFQKAKVLSLGLCEKKVFLKPNSIELVDIDSHHREGYIYVGRLEPSKGILVLLQAWEKLGEKFQLTIIGNGTLEEDLKKKYDHLSNIIFLGECDKVKTLKMVAQSQYLIQPSLLYETFGLTILEAMSVGTPVIGFDIGTRKDFILNNYNGFVCKPNEIKDIIYRSYNYEDYGNMQNNAISTARKYSNEVVISRQIEIYKSFLSAG